MNEHVVKILSTEYITHDVKRFQLEKPDGYTFIPGQATDISTNKNGWREKQSTFSFTSLNAWHFLEFTIKIYRERNRITKELENLKAGDELIVRWPHGAIAYKGPGVFISGGAGVTPFIAILRQLQSENKLSGNTLILSNKTTKDIILKDEFTKMLGENFINVITREKVAGYHYGRIDDVFIKQMVSDFTQRFYVCGPDKLVDSVTNILEKLGASVQSIVIEK